MVSGEAGLLTLIPAKGDSTGVPGKNLADLGGKGLLQHKVEAARAAGLEPVVSSDSAEIRGEAMNLGCEALTRPSELCGQAPLWEVCAYHAQGRAVLCLPPTAPFLSPASIALLLDGLPASVDCIFSVAEMPTHPSLAGELSCGGTGYIDHSHHFSFLGEPIWPRQERPYAAYPTGGMFYRSARLLAEPSGPNCMGNDPLGFPISQKEAINIDTPWDLEVARAIFAHEDARGDHSGPGDADQGRMPRPREPEEPGRVAEWL